jgi:DNA-binding transcriptional regulator YbjK
MMTALSLFDVTALAVQSQEPESASAREATARWMKVAESMVASAIEEFEKIRALDEVFAPLTDDADEDVFDRETAIVLRGMYEENACEAERILARVQRVERLGNTVKNSEVLRQWHRRTRAMLSISLDEIARSLQDVKQGRVISGTQVRNELHARLHR